MNYSIDATLCMRCIFVNTCTVLYLVAFCQIKKLHTAASGNQPFTLVGVFIVLFKDMANYDMNLCSDFFTALVMFWVFSNLQQWLVVPALRRYLPPANSKPKFVGRSCQNL